MPSALKILTSVVRLHKRKVGNFRFFLLLVFIYRSHLTTEDFRRFKLKGQTINIIYKI